MNPRSGWAGSVTVSEHNRVMLPATLEVQGSVRHLRTKQGYTTRPDPLVQHRPSDQPRRCHAPSTPPGAPHTAQHCTNGVTPPIEAAQGRHGIAPFTARLIGS